MLFVPFSREAERGMTDALEKIIRPIVEGQIRGFIKEHPSILKGVDWYKPRQDKAMTLTNSLAKRIVRDLACPINRARLAAALLDSATGASLSSTVERGSCGERALPDIYLGEGDAA